MKSNDLQNVKSSGVNRLLSQYKTIGYELLGVEETGLVSGFREGVTTINVEVLESYLEDLLDLSVTEEVLNLNVLSTNYPIFVSKLITFTKRRFPYIGLVRRIKFAKIVSAEVSRRRGRDGTTRTPIFDQLLGVSSRKVKTSFQGAAKVRSPNLKVLTNPDC